MFVRSDVILAAKSDDAKKKKSEGADGKSESKSNKKTVEPYPNENLIALIMVFLGIFISLSLNTESMGLLGRVIQVMFQGLLGKLSLVLSISVLILGAVRLIYYNRFTLKSISKSLIIFLSIELILFYGFISIESFPQGRYQWSVVKRMFLNSMEGLGIGVIPYSLTYFALKFMGKWGLLIFLITVFLFIIGYYFGIGPRKMFQHLKTSGAMAGGFLGMLKNLVFNFVTEEDDGYRDRERGIYADMKPYRSKYTRKRLRDDDDIVLPSKRDYRMKPLTKESYTYEEKKRGLFDIFFNKENLRKSEKKEEAFEEDSDSHRQLKAREEVEGQTEYGKEMTDPYQYNNVDELLIQRTEISSKEDPFQGHSFSKEEKSDIAVGEGEKEEGNTQAKQEYILPPYWLLDEHQKIKRNDSLVEKNAMLVEDTLKIFSVDAKVVNVSVGPSITRYELQPKTGTKVSKILNLTDDLCLALAAQSIRIEAPIPGKSLIGIEVSNNVTETVGFRSVVSDEAFRRLPSKVAFVLGKDVAGKTQVSDLVKMPHLLIAGSTGSGKSVCVNTLICSILFRATPDEVKFIMIDPKMVELSIYNGIPHLMMPVVTDMKKAPYALSWAVDEMNRRYKAFAENRVKDIEGYNRLFSNEKMPSIVIVVDELADLMLVSPKEVEDSICRLAQMARACGIHLVIATQRPSVDVITGLIKANIPSRIAFAVSSQTDSRTILDIGGAEKLLGKGDMLYYPIGLSKPLRIQGAFITEKEVSNIVSFINEQEASKAAEKGNVEEQVEEMIDNDENESEVDSLYDEVVEFAIEQGKVSTSLVQRKFRIGYNRASRIIDAMEENGVVGASDGVRPRTVLLEKRE